MQLWCFFVFFLELLTRKISWSNYCSCRGCVKGPCWNIHFWPGCIWARAEGKQLWWVRTWTMNLVQTWQRRQRNWRQTHRQPAERFHRWKWLPVVEVFVRVHQTKTVDTCSYFVRPTKMFQSEKCRRLLASQCISSGPGRFSLYSCLLGVCFKSPCCLPCVCLSHFLSSGLCG